jgi:hypothetical protein
MTNIEVEMLQEDKEEKEDNKKEKDMQKEEQGKEDEKNKKTTQTYMSEQCFSQVMTMSFIPIHILCASTSHYGVQLNKNEVK